MGRLNKFTVAELIKNNIIEKPYDGNHGAIHPKGNDFINSGIPFIMASDVENGRIDLKNCKFISKEQADSLRKGFAVEGDVLLTHKASIGRTAVVPRIDYPYIMLTPQVTYYRVKNKKVLNNLYLKYYFDSKPFQHVLGAMAGAGSTRAYLGIVGQQDLPIEFPDLPTQQKIAAVLSALDAKIELNARINAELESMAKTLYDYWFVQFEFPTPLSAPLSFGHPPKYDMETLGNTESRSVVFGGTEGGYKSAGGKMVWNEALKREIPLGWEVVSLGDFVDIFDAKRIPLSSSQRAKMQGQYPYYGATSIMDYVNDYIFDGEYLLIAEDGSVMGDDGLAIVQYIWGKTWVNNHAHVLLPKDSLNKDYLYFLLKSISVVQIMTGSIQKKITQDNLLGVKFALPDKEILKLFSEFSRPIRKRMINIFEESQTLTELRDWLLPMLMNGQVAVK